MSNHPQKSGSLCSGMSGSLCSGIGGSLYSGMSGSLYSGIGGSLYPGILNNTMPVDYIGQIIDMNLINMGNINSIYKNFN